mgnify:CR=1 FL=1
MSYSKVLVNRFLIVLVLSTFIVLSLILISRSLQTEQFVSSSYIPKEKVERVSILIREWNISKSSSDHKINVQDENNTKSKVLIHFINQFSCSQRVKNIIYTSAIKTIKKHSLHNIRGNIGFEYMNVDGYTFAINYERFQSLSKKLVLGQIIIENPGEGYENKRLYKKSCK